MSISDDTFNKIKGEKIEKTPTWYFQFSRIALVTGILLSIILTAFSFGLVFEYIFDLELDFYSRFNPNIGEYIFRNIPLILILLLIVLLILVYFEIRNSPKGYKLEKPVLIISVIGITLFTGVVLTTTGLSRFTSNFLSENTLSHSIFSPDCSNYFSTPDEGILLGRVVEVYSPNGCIVVDQSGRLWNVVTPNPLSISEGVVVRSIGQDVGRGRFVAEEIRTLSPRIEQKCFETK